jgi:DUF1680 family protein
MKVAVKVNGTEQGQINDAGYITLTRKWKQGDKVEIILPMAVQQVVANQNVKENEGLVAIEYGPFVYCAEETDNKTNFSNAQIPKDIEFKVEKQDNRIGNIQVITYNLKPDDSTTKMTFIPYYAWSNRGIGKMKVWFQQMTK